MAMKAWTLALWVTVTLWATDERQLALALKAQGDFERVQLAARPSLAEAETCQQSQAAVLTVTPPEEVAQLHFRKGFCALAGAVATRNNAQYLGAAAEFDQARETWPAHQRKRGKNEPAEPVPSELRVLAAIARLQAGGGDAERGKARVELAEAVDRPVCTSSLMAVDFCRQVVDLGREWLGWIALGDGQLDQAARLLAASTDSGWSQWVQGRRSFDAGSYANAVTSYRRATEIWKSIWENPGLLRALGPRPTLPVALADLGGAQLLAGDTAAATITLDAAIKADATAAHPLYLRARAKELAGQTDAALADYNLASRTAFAAAHDLASGEAHLYRGIVLYRRKDFQHAEDEFASALNFEIMPALHADATAWRHLAALAGGECGTSVREPLAGSMGKVSPFFPKEEARALAAACAGTAQR